MNPFLIPLMMCPVQLVVSRESACIGHGDEQSLEANHMEMNKFGPHGRNYKNYLLFIAQLLVMYNKGKEIVRNRFSGRYVDFFSAIGMLMIN